MPDEEFSGRKFGKGLGLGCLFMICAASLIIGLSLLAFAVTT